MRNQNMPEYVRLTIIHLKEQVQTNLDVQKPNNLTVLSRKCSVKKLFLKISQNLQENICAKDSDKKETRDCGTGAFLWILQNF